MFENSFIDWFSRVHPVVPAVIFLPVIVAMIWLGADRGYNALQVAGLMLIGVVLWTLTEYWLHRTVFHWEPDHGVGRRLHYMIHGVHHEHPNDRMRLVMPSSFSLPLGAVVLALYVLVFGTPGAFPIFAGMLLGYLWYDYTHYFLHHHMPKSELGKRLREQHMRHHFQDEDAGFGVSTPLWDYVFRTMPKRH